MNSYNTELQNNNVDLQTVLDMINNLPTGGSGTGKYVWKKSKAGLVSTGTQYIDTGIVANSETKIEVDFMWDYIAPNTSSWSSVFGTRNPSDSTGMFNITVDAENSYVAYGNVETSLTSGYNEVNKRYLVELSKNGVLVNGVLVHTWDNNWISSADNSIYLFGRNDAGNLANPMTGRMYSCKIYNGDILVRDYILHYEDNNPCFYDKVSGTNSINLGTGVFAVSGASDFVCVADDDENKYPDGGVVDGYYYKRVEISDMGTLTKSLKVTDNELYTLPSMINVNGTTIDFKFKYSGKIKVYATVYAAPSNYGATLRFNNTIVVTNNVSSGEFSDSMETEVVAGTTYQAKFEGYHPSNACELRSLKILGSVAVDESPFL